MTGWKKPMSAAFIGRGLRDVEPALQLRDLEYALKLDPENDDLKSLCQALRRRMENGPAYVAIERAVILGKASRKYETEIFIEEADGRLKPINGEELVELHSRFPNFVKRWNPQGE